VELSVLSLADLSCKFGKVFVVQISAQTGNMIIGSTIAEGPRDALCQLKSCQMLQSCTKSHFEKPPLYALCMTLKLVPGHRICGHYSINRISLLISDLWQQSLYIFLCFHRFSYLICFIYYRQVYA